MRGISQGGPERRGRAGRPAGRARAAALLGGGLAAVTTAGVLAGPAAAATGPAWRVVRTVHGANLEGITAVAAAGPGQSWAFQSGSGRPVAWRLAGSRSVTMPFPGQPGETVTAAGATSARNLWAFTATPSGATRVLRWNGTAWAVVHRFRQEAGRALVLGPADVWMFGVPTVPGSGLGTWHYNGRGWHRFPGLGMLTGGSALSPSDIWAVGGKTAAHWNGTAWSVTSLARVLPPNTQFCHPSADYPLARSDRDVWAAGAGHCQDERGPFYLLHLTGAGWRLVAGAARFGEPSGLAADGSGGLWIPTVAGFPGTFAMLHYTGGRLARAAMPLPGTRLAAGALAHVPHTAVTYAGGASYPAANPGLNRAAVILRYGR
jgi:hypothetical protein